MSKERKTESAHVRFYLRNRKRLEFVKKLGVGESDYLIMLDDEYGPQLIEKLRRKKAKEMSDQAEQLKRLLEAPVP